MPPRHAYWTIIVDDQATSFRAHDVEELLPTYNRLREKHPSAILKWFERGRLWESRDAARQAGGGEGERGRWRDDNARTDDVRTGRASDRDERPGGYPRDSRNGERGGGDRSSGDRSAGARSAGAGDRRGGDRRGERDAGFSERSDSRSSESKGAPAERQGGGRSEDWRADRPDDGDSRSGGAAAPPERKGDAPPADRERRDRAWRPGGEHRDPRQKYKDAKKAKWTRFKQNIRSKWDDRQDRGERPAPSRVEGPFDTGHGGAQGKPESDRGDRTPPHGDPLRSKVSREDRDRDSRPAADRDDRRGAWQSKPGGWKPKGRPPGPGGWRPDDRDRDRGGWKPKGPPRDRNESGARGPDARQTFGTTPGRKPWGPPKPDGARKPWGSKPAGRKPWGSKPGGARKPWESKPGGARKPWGPRAESGSRTESRGDKPAGARKPWSSKPPAGGKPWGRKPAGGGAPFRGRKKPFDKGPRPPKKRDDEE